MTEHKSELLFQNYKSLFLAFKSFEQSMHIENPKCSVVCQNFLRFSEILINIFFRILESDLYGSLSANEEECINRIIEKKIVSSSKNWEVFLLIKNQLQNPGNRADSELILQSVSSQLLEFSSEIMESIQVYLEKTILPEKID